MAFISQTPDKLEISLPLVAGLIREQFPKWAHLPIRPIKLSGWDNRTFHLGKEMSIRLLSGEGYAGQVPKEQAWLPRLAPHLSFSIPKPLALGLPSQQYPWNWSVYQWIEGENADALHGSDLQQFASDIAQFLHELHKIDAKDGPAAGAHNYYRGASPAVYDKETQLAIAQLEDVICVDGATHVWEQGVSSKWSGNPVWIHGDLSVENLLVKEGRLVAVIDFGCMGVGDPACDLVIAWTFLTQETRKVFRSHLELDSDTWSRARGWCLWKALTTLASLPDKRGLEALKIQRVIGEILEDHELENQS